MAQYTDNLIPTMTSNTTPSGIVFTNGIWESNNDYAGFNAFDKNINTRYVANGTTGIICYMFPTVVKIAKYTLIEYLNEADRMPKNWTFEGSNNSTNGLDGNWAILDSQSNISSWQTGVKKEFIIENNNNYNSYRLNISINNGGTNLQIAEIEMMELLVINKFLIKQGTQYYSIKPEFYDNTTTHEFTPLTLTSGNSYPNADDYNNSGFDDVGALCTSTTVGSDTFRPVDKFGETKITGASFTTTDNKVYTVNPTANKPFKRGSVVCYSNDTVVTPDSIDYTNGTVTFNTAQTGTMTFDYIYMYKFKIMMYKSKNYDV